MAAIPKRRSVIRDKPKIARFTISAALLEELGERLVSRPDVALAELIKNGYDADASTCVISLEDEEIVVADNGHGMTESEFLNNWMVVSSQAKGLQRFSRRYKRAMAGSKGVGRFSARFLGNTVMLTSVTQDPETSKRTRLAALFDWTKISREETISSIEIQYTVEPVADESLPNGTVLRIGGLRREAKQISSSKVKTDILRLTTPISGLESPPFVAKRPSGVGRPQKDPGFSVSFTDDSGDGDGELAPTVQASIVDSYVGRVRLQVDETGLLSYDVFWRGEDEAIDHGEFKLEQYCSKYTPEKLKPTSGQAQDDRGLAAAVADVKQLPLARALHSPVFIDLRFFPRRKGTFSDLEVNGTKAQRWIREHASVAIVDNTFAMNAYGLGSDWLGIDASKATNERRWQSIFTPILFPMSERDRADPQRNPMLALPRGSQLIGRIHIATRKRPQAAPDDSENWLQPNMDRESLRDNGAFRLLWHISRFAAELIAHFDRARRLQEEERANALAAQAAKGELSKAIAEIRSSPLIDPAYRDRIVQQLKSAQARYAEAAEYDRDFRQSLELMSMMGVIAGFMTHEFEKAMKTLSDAADLIRDLAASDRRLKSSAEEIAAMERSLAHYMDYMRLFVNKARQPKRQQFKANAQVSLVVETLSAISKAHNIQVEVAIEPSLAGPFVPVAAYHGIVANLLSNAMKSLVPKTTNEKRQVRIYATNDATRHVLVCADNGIGVPDYLRDRIWDPLFTTTADADEDNPLGSGLGLGLSVVKEVLKGLKGSIELLDAPPPGFVTAFRVALPLH